MFLDTIKISQCLPWLLITAQHLVGPGGGKGVHEVMELLDKDGLYAPGQFILVHSGPWAHSTSSTLDHYTQQKHLHSQAAVFRPWDLADLLWLMIINGWSVLWLIMRWSSKVPVINTGLMSARCEKHSPHWTWVNSSCDVVCKGDSYHGTRVRFV